MALNQFYGYFTNIFAEFNDIVTAIVIVLIGFIIARILSRITQKILHEAEINRIVKKATGFKVSLEEMVSKFVKYFVYFVVVIMALNQLGLTTTLLYIIAAVLLVIMAAAFLLGVKDFIPNMIAGIVIHKKGHIKIRDVIKVRDIEGKIIHIDLTETRILTNKGDTIYLPNSILTKEKVVVKKRAKR